MSLSTPRPEPVTAEGGTPGAALLIVCTGNVCRSAIAEAFLRDAFGGGGADDVVAVRSAGTHALVGDDIDPLSAEVCHELGVDPSSHRARQLERAHARDADLILTATRAHRRHVVQLEPRAVRYTFTIRQAGRLLTSLQQGDAPSVATEARHGVEAAAPGPLDLRDLRVALARQRGAIGVIGDPADDDVLDPRGRSLDSHREAARQMMPALEGLVSRLALVTDPA